MGLSLCCYSLIGPVELDESRKEKAKEMAKKFVADAQSASDCSEYWTNSIYTHPDHFLEEMKSSPEELVDCLYSLWNKVDSVFRDKSSRTVSLKGPSGYKRYKIVVAGETVDGNEPEGDGYWTLKLSDAIGLLDFFDIK